MKIINALGLRLSGTIGKAITASSWRGCNYIREYVKPRNANTERQRSHRAIFKAAVDAWHNLRDCQKEFYNRIADEISGYNLFVSRYVKAVRRGETPEFPVMMSWTVDGRKRVKYGLMIISRGSKRTITCDLKKAGGVFVLTPSDAPYIFTLGKGSEKEKVLVVDDLLGTEVPLVLESDRLGIRIILDCERR